MILASLNTNSEGKHRNAMNRSLLMCTKFQINQVIVTLFSGVWDKNPGFSLGCLHMGGQVQGDKALMGGLMRGHRPYGGDLTLIDYIIN